MILILSPFLCRDFDCKSDYRGFFPITERLQVRSQGTQSGVGMYIGMRGHARSRYIQQDDVAFYLITLISCFRFDGAWAAQPTYRISLLAAC